VGGHVQFDFLVVQLAFPQHLAEFLPGVGFLRLGVRLPGIPGAGQQGVEDALLGGFLGAHAHLAGGLLAGLLDGDLREIADDAVHVLAHIAHLGELGGLHLDEGGAGQAGQTTGDLGLADPGRAYHQDVFRGHFMAHPSSLSCIRRQRLRRATAHRTLGIGLTDDVLCPARGRFLSGVISDMTVRMAMRDGDQSNIRPRHRRRRKQV
jgi:hypothetical protein